MLTYPLNFIEYEAAQAQTYHATRSSGIFSDGDFRCSASGEDNTVTISAGLGWIAPRKFEGMSISEQTETTKELSIADALSPRWDIIAIQFDREKNKTDIIVKKGTANSEPQMPERVTTELIYELYLCKIYRPAGSVVIDPANITDLRLDKQYCGIMSSAIDEIDTQGIVEQANGVIKNLNTNGEKEIQKIKTNGEQLITELQKKIKEVESGASDMLKITYDTNNNGTVDDSEKLGGKLPSHYAALETQGITLYTQNSENGNLTSENSNGHNGKFKATKAGSFETININGENKTVKQGADTGIDLTAGSWYTFILDGDTVNFSSGGMGGYNFKIVGGADKPVSPVNNTIWVKTDLPIGKWELSYEQPTTRPDGEPLQEGDIWLEMSYTSLITFNAVKRDSIKVKIVRGRQYVGSEWVTKTISGYIDNKWIDDTFYLFSAELKVNRGEWSTSEWSSPSKYLSRGQISASESNIYISLNYSGVANTDGYFVGTNNTPLDVTNFGKLKIVFNSLKKNSSDIMEFGLRTEVTAGGPANSITIPYGSSSEQTFELDIKELTGIYYFSFYFADRDRSYDRGMNASIKSINLEQGE